MYWCYEKLKQNFIRKTWRKRLTGETWIKWWTAKKQNVRMQTDSRVSGQVQGMACSEHVNETSVSVKYRTFLD
jgi:hypothetical protein